MALTCSGCSGFRLFGNLETTPNTINGVRCKASIRQRVKQLIKVNGNSNHTMRKANGSVSLSLRCLSTFKYQWFKGIETMGLKKTLARTGGEEHDA